MDGCDAGLGGERWEIFVWRATGGSDDRAIARLQVLLYAVAGGEGKDRTKLGRAWEDRVKV
jgi:hypothetical protein